MGRSHSHPILMEFHGCLSPLSHSRAPWCLCVQERGTWDTDLVLTHIQALSQGHWDQLDEEGWNLGSENAMRWDCSPRQWHLPHLGQDQGSAGEAESRNSARWRILESWSPESSPGVRLRMCKLGTGNVKQRDDGYPLPPHYPALPRAGIWQESHRGGRCAHHCCHPHPHILLISLHLWLSAKSKNFIMVLFCQVVCLTELVLVSSFVKSKEVALVCLAS